MSLGLSVAIANDILDAVVRADPLATLPIAATWVQLHTGDPGSVGTANVAGNATRKQATFGSAAASGGISNTAALTWTSGEVTTNEDYTHCSLWTASTAGTFAASGLLTANAVFTGDTFTIPIGDLDITLTTAG